MSNNRIIKKYPNRRLYDTHQSCYITLNDVRELVMSETPFQVVDRQTGEDITRNILLQIILEQESGGKPLFSAEILSQFIRHYGVNSQQGFTTFMEQSMKLFNSHQQAISEQMQKALSGTPLDTWLKLSEQNLQTWNKMQQELFKGLSVGRRGDKPSSPDQDSSDTEKTEKNDPLKRGSN
ncbi:MAG: polyhydroxyalkanoate synthesis repressor PhaR [Proteobacteria bacterium]|nr:MAG: polyhydroxyalkanoate synthesis repressor PhaR [Pseudomonadota bacterium]